MKKIQSLRDRQLRETRAINTRAEILLLPFLVGWGPRANDLIFWCFNFFIHRMGIITVPTFRQFHTSILMNVSHGAKDSMCCGAQTEHSIQSKWHYQHHYLIIFNRKGTHVEVVTGLGLSEALTLDATFKRVPQYLAIKKTMFRCNLSKNLNVTEKQVTLNRSSKSLYKNKISIPELFPFCLRLLHGSAGHCSSAVFP